MTGPSGLRTAEGVRDAERRKEKVPSHPCVVCIPYVMDVQTAPRIPTNILTSCCYVYLCAHF